MPVHRFSLPAVLKIFSGVRLLRLSLSLLLSLIVSTTLYAQPSHQSLTLTGGRVIPVNGSPFSGFSPTLGADYSLYWRQNDTTLYWTQFWRHPYFGLRANYAQIGNSIAGNRIGVAGFIQAPVYRHLDWVYSVGLSFYTNPYQRTPNPDNDFIGSYVNCLIDLGLCYSFPLRGENSLFLAFKLVHSSNGYLYKPNHGLNYLQLELGYRFGMQHSDHYVIPHPAWHIPDTVTLRRNESPLRYSDFRKDHLFFSIAPGAVMSRNDPLDLIKYYFTYTFEVGYIRHFHPAFSFGAALDLSYNGSHQQLAHADEWPIYPALTAFWDNHWGPLTLRLGLAHYLAYYPQNWEQYYERVGLFYRFGPHYNQHLGVAMKVHYDHVDYIEWTYAIEL